MRKNDKLSFRILPLGEQLLSGYDARGRMWFMIERSTRVESKDGSENVLKLIESNLGRVSLKAVHDLVRAHIVENVPQTIFRKNKFTLNTALRDDGWTETTASASRRSGGIHRLAL